MNQVLTFAPMPCCAMDKMCLKAIVVISLAMTLFFHSALRGETAKLRAGSKIWIFQG